MQKSSEKTLNYWLSGLEKWHQFILTAAIVLIAFIRSYNRVHEWNFTLWIFDYQSEFIKRGLPGEILRWTGLNITYDFVSAISLALVFVLLGVMLFVFSAPLRQSPKDLGLWLFFLVALAHPATFQHFNFDSGRFDVICLLLSLLSILVIARTSKIVACFVVPLLLIISLLVHEASLFMYVPLVFAYWIYREPEPSLLPYKALTLGLLIAVTYLISTHGLVLNQSFEEHMQALKSVYGDLVVAGSVIVLHKGTLAENIEFTIENALNLRYAVNHIIVMVVLTPLAILLWKVVKIDIPAKTKTNKLRLLLILSAFGPMLLIPIAIDHFRWWSLALTNLFLVLSILALEDKDYSRNINNVFSKHSRLALFVLLSGIILGPIRVISSFDVVNTAALGLIRLTHKIPWIELPGSLIPPWH